MKEKYIIPYINRHTPGFHKTRGGVVHYRDKRRRQFGIKDLLRILFKVNNRENDDMVIMQSHYVQWRAAFDVCRRNYEYLLDKEIELNGSITDRGKEIAKSYGENFEQWLLGFDSVVSLGQSLLGNVPGAGQILSVVSWFYGFVREHFPVV
jgi:hypothetical protein